MLAALFPASSVPDPFPRRQRLAVAVLLRRACLAGLVSLPGLLLSAPLLAATWIVGPAPPSMSLRDALAVAADGDTIALMAGEYNGQVGVIEQRRLTLRGIGERPVLRAGGRHAEGKGILVVRGGEVLIENVEFRSARVPDGNGAGIRLERGRLKVVRSAFYDNEIGLLTGNDPETELEIVDSEFGQAPQVTGGLHHLLYAGRIGRLTVTGSRFHEGYEGHLIKSRARQTRLFYNLIYDGWSGGASYEVDLPNGGEAWLVGNVIGQSPETQNRALVSFGAEGDPWPRSALYLAHNTLISPLGTPAWFLRTWSERLPANAPVVAVNNVLAGVGVLKPGTSGTMAGNGRTLGRWLRSPDTLDFSLPHDSRLRGTAVDVRQIEGQDLTPKAEFQLPVGTRPLSTPTRSSPGAFQQ